MLALREQDLPDFDAFVDAEDELAGIVAAHPRLADVFAIVCRRAQALVQPATRGEPPLAALERDLTPIAADFPAPELSLFLDRLVRKLLATVRFSPGGSSARPTGPAWLTGRLTTFFRRAEEVVFDSLEDADPVTLFTTHEESRFVEELLSSSGRLAPGGHIIVWTIASGFLEPTAPGALELTPTTFPGRPASTLGISLQRLSELDSDHELRKEFLKTSELTSHGRILSLGYDVKHHCMGAVVDDSHGPIDARALAELSQAFRERLAREFDEERRARVRSYLANVPAANRFSEGIRMALNPSWPGGIYIFLDVHRELDPSVFNSSIAENIRVVRDAHQYLKNGPRDRRLLLFAQDFSVPENLLQELRRIDLPLPGRGELAAATHKVLEIYGSAPSSRVSTREIIRRAVDAISGLTLQQSLSAMHRIAERHGYVPETFADSLQEIKCEQLNSEGVLTVVQNPLDFKPGGLEQLGSWLEKRRRVFERPDLAATRGIDRRPKGLLMLGISGSGKSLAAKLVAKEWGLPLLRLDASAIYDRWVGASEARLRRALKIAETIAPCVLWIDELEKGFGVNSDSSGVSQRVLGSLLVWMQETTAPVFTVATANDVTQLPPELTRAGRFDGRFFLGCPGPAGREEIFGVHLSKRHQSPSELVDEDVIKATHGFTGAEIEQVVLDALYTSYATDSPISRDLLLATAQRVKPLVGLLGKSMEQVWEMVDHGRAELASVHTLTRKDVATLIDPGRFSPMYCRLKCIGGFEHEAERAERIVASQPSFGSAVCVLDIDNPEWVYAQCNFPFESGDEFAFKFLDRLNTVEANDIFFMLCRQHALEVILFENVRVYERFKEKPLLLELEHLFAVVGQETMSNFQLTENNSNDREEPWSQ